MQNPLRAFRYITAIGAGIALNLSAGSAKSITPSVASIRDALAYQPERSAVQIDAGATVESSATQDASVKTYFQRTVRYSEAAVANSLQARAETLANDIINSGLFARIRPAGDPTADYLVKIRDEESRFPDWVVRVTLRVVDAKSGQELSVHSREVVAGMTPYQQLFPGMMAALKTEMMSDLLGQVRQRQEQATLAEAIVFQKAALTDLLAGSDKWAALARERNRALIAARTQQLPGILRDRKTDELTALAVKIEQTILDLNHECEVAKDQAQLAAANPDASAGRSQAVVAGARGFTVGELRDLSISYRERIELLKPIAAALKEEIANRSR